MFNLELLQPLKVAVNPRRAKPYRPVLLQGPVDGLGTPLEDGLEQIQLAVVVVTVNADLASC